MKFFAGNIYHIYNQGNNRQQTFFSRNDYLDFLKLYRKEIAPNCETLCYCLMPNHFHFLAYANEKSINEFKLGNLTIQKLADGYRRMLSTYSTGVAKRINRTGAFFKPKTKAKEMEAKGRSIISSEEFCFHYIHQNPWRAGLVSNASDWEFSSLQDYEGARPGTICNRDLAFELFGWGKSAFKSPEEKLALDENKRRIIYDSEK